MNTVLNETIKIPRKILKGASMRTFIIAEAGVNHNGQPDLAFALIDAAVRAGVDAVKFQTFSAEKIVGKKAGKAAYQEAATGPGSQYEMLKRLELSDDVHRELMAYCKKEGVEFMSTPFDAEAADFLINEGMECFKIPSGEITNHPFLRHLASKNLPMIISTGMSTLEEVNAAIAVIAQTRASLKFDQPLTQMLTVLHCTSNYPTKMSDVNLRAMQTLADATGMPIGYSDHTQGISVCSAAVALGARVLEKHFTLDRSMEGPDHKASLEPGELTELVKQVRDIEQALGSAKKTPTDSEMEMRVLARRSVAATVNLSPGDVLTEVHLSILRPATGIEPQYYDELLGRIVGRAVLAGAALQWDDLTRKPS